MFQFNIVFGILIAFLSNSLLGDIGENSWRWMLGVLAFPSLLFTILCFGLPESPRWLIVAKVIGGWFSSTEKQQGPVQQRRKLSIYIMKLLIPLMKKQQGGALFTRRLLKPVLLAFFIAFFNQLSAIFSMPSYILPQGFLKWPDLNCKLLFYNLLD